MSTTPLLQNDLDALAEFDTPTICNALEKLDAQTQANGFTTEPFLCGFPAQKPIVGYARTATIRATMASGLPAAEQKARRLAYYDYVGTGIGPRISVIQDIDGPDAGYGAFWGEVNSAVHRALGCLGVVTDGSIRDIPQWAPDFQALAAALTVSSRIMPSRR